MITKILGRTTKISAAILIVATSFFQIVSLLILPQIAHANPAFGGFGDGVLERPYMIADCDQLQQIGLDTTAYYIVVRDIDCAETVYETITDDFSGTLDGLGHKITGLNIAGKGLFETINGGSISNLRLSDGVVDNGSTYSTASFAGFSRGSSSLSNVQSDLSVSAGAEVGGFVGKAISGTLTISQSSYTGTLASSGGYIGGLVGVVISSATVNITDSYHNGDIEAAAFVGGLIGAATSGSTLNIDRSYSAGTLTVQYHFAQGGLIGVMNTTGTITDSFAANTIVGTGAGDIGAVVGTYTAGTFDNTWYDYTLAGELLGSGAGVISNVSGNSTSEYFMPPANSDRSLFVNWDISDSEGIWQPNDNDYPTLQNELRTTGLDNGDSNGDSIQDSFQPNVASAINGDELVATISVPLKTGCLLDNFSGPYPSWWSNSAYTDPDTKFSYPTPAKVDFKLLCPTPGMTVPVTVTFDKAYDTSHWVLRHYNATTHVSSTITGATFGTATVNGTTRTTATYNLTDNGDFDSDPAGGVIVDPVSPANYTGTIPAQFQGIGVPNTGL